MIPFRLFLSHCDAAPDHPLVRPLYDLLRNSLSAEIKGGALEILYDGKDPVAPGESLRKELLHQVRRSDLLLACFTRRWQQAEYFREEVKAALAARIAIIPILLLEPDDDILSFRLGDLHPDLEDGTGRLAHVAVTIRIGDVSTATSVHDAIRSQQGSELGGDLIRQIRAEMIDRARRDVTVYDRKDQVLHDLSIQPSPYIDIFLYDGGTTIHQMAFDHEFSARLRAGALRIRFLYVDTNFKDFISTTPEFLARPELASLGGDTYAALYEALVRCSGMLHNRSPEGHLDDVRRSIKSLEGLAAHHNVKLEVRSTSQLPFYRMIVTRQYVYYTHFLPAATDVPGQREAPEYHSIRLSAESPAGKALASHFQTLWDQAVPHASR